MAIISAALSESITILDFFFFFLSPENYLHAWGGKDIVSNLGSLFTVDVLSPRGSCHAFIYGLHIKVPPQVTE